VISGFIGYNNLSATAPITGSSGQETWHYKITAPDGLDTVPVVNLNDVIYLEFDSITPTYVQSNILILYYTDKLAVSIIKKGMLFNIVNVIEVTKHGISTIDSGSGPIYYLVLKDQNNVLYKIGTVMLGINEEDLFLSFRDSFQLINPQSVKFLSPSSFDTKNSFEYNGNLTIVE